MPILKLKPAYKDYIWGGTRLISDYNKVDGGTRLAESWELSCHADGASRIIEGEESGKTLQEYIEQHGRQVLGDDCLHFEDFPILIKFIDAKDDLSIQVHPSDTYALKNENQYGKTEMWYVMDCEDGAFLYYGFASPISKEEFIRRINENSLTEVLNKVYVKKGDVLFIEAGTIHAIGKNILIAEIQQNSNITYRVYDYGRRGADGKMRDLHIEKALAVTNRNPVVKEKTFSPHIASCEYFTVDKIYLDGKNIKKINGCVGKESFVSLLILEGEGVIWAGNEVMKIKKGDSIFLSAGSGEYELAGNLEGLMTTV